MVYIAGNLEMVCSLASKSMICDLLRDKRLGAEQYLCSIILN